MFPPSSIHRDPTVPYRIGVIGGGPRGFYVIESLARHSRSMSVAAARPLEIVLFETTGVPGAGTIYHRDNPDHLRMNFANRHIDAFPRDDVDQGDADPAAPSLMQWSASTGRPLDPDGVCPRRMVGEYLRECFNRVIDRLPETMSVSVVDQRVIGVEMGSLARDRDRLGNAIPRGNAIPQGDAIPGGDARWTVQTSDAEFGFDVLVLTTGHEGWCPPPGDFEGIRGIYPVDQQLSRRHVPAGSTVSVRGFGLTFIDAVLSLTEGRGGRFEVDAPADQGSGASDSFGCRGGRCERLTYRSGSESVARVYPHSRSGRPMLAKPIEGLFEPSSRLDRMWQIHEDRFAALEDLADGGHRLDLQRQVMPVIWSAADGAMRLRGGGDNGCEEFFRRWCSWTMTPIEVRRVMARSLAIARRERTVDPAWAIGVAWRRLYAGLTSVVAGRIGGGGLDPDDWDSFASLAAEMERIAFGPPAENVARCLALIDAGVLDLSELHRQPPGNDSARTLIDARIPGPQQFKPGGIVTSMIDQGWLSTDPIRGGVRVNDWGGPIGSNLRRPGTLAVFGRCTEGWVMGNDSLSRRLDPRIDRWAREFCRQNAEQSDCTTPGPTTPGPTNPGPTNLEPKSLGPTPPNQIAMGGTTPGGDRTMPPAVPASRSETTGETRVGQPILS